MPFVTLLKSAQASRERHQVIRTNKLDPEWGPTGVNIDVDHVRQLNRARDFPDLDSFVCRYELDTDLDESTREMIALPP